MLKGIESTPEERLERALNRIDEMLKESGLDGDVEAVVGLSEYREKIVKEFNRPAAEKTHFGWMREMLWKIEGMFFKRWEYWLNALERWEVPKEPIPKISFLPQTTSENGHPRVMENIDFCMRPFQINTSPMVLIKWLLWSFGDQSIPEKPREMTNEMEEHWYRSFELNRFYEAPGDSMFPIYAKQKTGVAAFFPTPSPIAQMMAEMTFGTMDGEEAKIATVNEPCCGTGIMLLHASNYSLRLSGQDVSDDMVLMTKLNSWIYIPWVAMPAPDSFFEKK